MRDRAIKERYPRVWELFSQLDDGPMHLDNMMRLDAEFARFVESGGARRRGPGEDGALRRGRAADFDIIYAGGTLSLPHAVLMARRGYRVLVFDRTRVGFVRREWNVGRDEFAALYTSGLFTPEQAEAMALRRYDRGLVRWHGGRDLYVEGVLDVPLDAEALMSEARDALEEAGGKVQDGWTLTGYRAWADQVRVRIETDEGEVQLSARLLVLATGASATRDFDLVCPTAGTVATGYALGDGPREVDPDVGEVLASTEGIEDGRQLIWELFPGRGREVTTYLFYYHEPRPQYPGAVLELFERYLEKLPSYKRGGGPAEGEGVEIDGVRHLRPVYGLIPAYTRQLNRSVSPCDRVLAYGDAAAQQSPLTFTGFGSALRHLTRMVDGVDLALKTDQLEQAHLEQLRAGQINTNILGRLTLMMTVRPGRPFRDPQTINALLIAAFESMWEMEEEAIRAFMQDRFSWAEFTRFMLGTMNRHPAIFEHVFYVLDWREVLAFVQDYVRFGLESGARRV